MTVTDEQFQQLVDVVNEIKIALIYSALEQVEERILETLAGKEIDPALTARRGVGIHTRLKRLKYDSVENPQNWDAERKERLQSAIDSVIKDIFEV